MSLAVPLLRIDVELGRPRQQHPRALATGRTIKDHDPLIVRRRGQGVDGTIPCLSLYLYGRVPPCLGTVWADTDDVALRIIKAVMVHVQEYAAHGVTHRQMYVILRACRKGRTPQQRAIVIEP